MRLYRLLFAALLPVSTASCTQFEMPGIGRPVPPPASITEDRPPQAAAPSRLEVLNPSAPLQARKRFFTLKPATGGTSLPDQYQRWTPVKGTRLSDILPGLLQDTSIGLDIDSRIPDRLLPNLPALSNNRAEALDQLAEASGFAWHYEAKPHKIFLTPTKQYTLTLPPMGWRALETGESVPPPVAAFRQKTNPYTGLLALLPAGVLQQPQFDQNKSRVTASIAPARLEGLKKNLEQLQEQRQALAMRAIVWRSREAMPPPEGIAGQYGNAKVVKGNSPFLKAVAGSHIPPEVLKSVSTKETIAKGWLLGMEGVETAVAFAEHPVLATCKTGRDKAPAGMVMHFKPLTGKDGKNSLQLRIVQPKISGKTPCAAIAATAVDTQTMTLPFTSNEGVLLTSALPGTARHYIVWLQPYWIKL